VPGAHAPSRTPFRRRHTGTSLVRPRTLIRHYIPCTLA
jgi:hypothetical protein